MSFVIHQISTKLPDDLVSNREFSFLLPAHAYPEGFHPDTADHWIFERTGIKTRPIVQRSQMGKRTAPIDAEFDLTLQALVDFHLSHQDWQGLDIIITLKSTPSQYSPSLSQKLVHYFSEKFSLSKNIFTLDLFQPSTGLLAAFKLLASFPFKNAWVIIPEILSPYLNVADIGSSVLFGDGVAALWVTRGGARDLEKKSLYHVDDVNFGSIPDTHQVLGFLDTNESAYMKGPELFKKIVPEFKKSALAILEKNQLTQQSIQYYLPHQANSRIIDRVSASLGFKPAQVITNIQHVGNLASASMPVALHSFLKNHSIQSGERILMNACGAGLSTGAALLRAI